MIVEAARAEAQVADGLTIERVARGDDLRERFAKVGVETLACAAHAVIAVAFEDDGAGSMATLPNEVKLPMPPGTAVKRSATLIGGGDGLSTLSTL